MADAVDVNRLPSGGTWNGIVGLRDVDPTTYTKHNVSTADGGSDATGTMQTTATAAQINAAIAAASGGSKYIELAAGTFTINANIMLESKVSLRGQVDANGIPTTIFDFNDETKQVYLSQSTSVNDYYQGGTTGWTTRDISSGCTRGSTSIVVSSTPTGLAVGNLMYLSAPHSAATGNISNTEFSRLFADVGAGGRPSTQFVKVTNINGTTITFTPAVNQDFWTGTLQAHWRALADQIDWAGLENLSIKCDNGATMFEDRIVIMQGANQCWMRNVFTYGVGGSDFIRNHVHMYACYGCEVSHCDLDYGEPNASSSMYAMTIWGCSGCLIVNNNITQTANICPMFRSDGNAWVYNYCHDTRYDNFLSQYVFDHGCQDHYNLYEGNWNPTHYNDGSNDSNSTAGRNNTYVRNRLPGWESPKDTNLNAITFLIDHVNVTMAANVMGTTSKQDEYQGDGSIGENSIYNSAAGVNSTMDRLGNYNYFDAAIPAGESLGGDTVSDSYLYPSKPDWFGNLSWPWVDPTNPTPSNTVTNFPAGYRAVNGEDPPNDPITLETTNLNATTLTVG